ncbi:MAG: glycosyltransferase [Candidatus Omnitrophota bacterium]
MQSRIVRSLYISYNGINEPIVRSQVIPYLRELSKKGIRFYLLTFEKERLDRSERNRIRSMLDAQFAGGAGVEWLSLTYHKWPSVPAKVFDIAAGFIYASYIIMAHKIDIVHARAIVAAAAGLGPAKLFGRKFIFDTRGIDSEEYVDGALWPRGGFRHTSARFFEDVITRSSDRVIVLTDIFLGIMKERYKSGRERFSAIPCAVDTGLFKFRAEKDPGVVERLRLKDKFVIVYSGSLGTWYMLGEMVGLFAEAMKHIGNAHLLIITGADRGIVTDAMKEGLVDERRVTVIDAAYEEMPGYLSACDLGIFFIKPVFSKLSSSPVKFAEYLASGLPVIINSGIGDTDGIVKRYDVGAVVGNFTARDYSGAVEYVISMLKNGKEGLKKRCAAAAEKEFSLTEAVERYSRIYSSLITDRTK